MTKLRTHDHMWGRGIAPVPTNYFPEPFRLELVLRVRISSPHEAPVSHKKQKRRKS